MINDEQHHLSKGMIMLCNTWRGKRIVGLTGTPFRREITREDIEKYYFDESYETGLESLPLMVLTYKYKHTYTAEDWIKASANLNPESVEVQRMLLHNNDDRIVELKKVLTRLYEL